VDAPIARAPRTVSRALENQAPPGTRTNQGDTFGDTASTGFAVTLRRQVSREQADGRQRVDPSARRWRINDTSV
jgi:hypothetical protein